LQRTTTGLFTCYQLKGLTISKHEVRSQRFVPLDDPIQRAL
jgi:hypothetical protein